MNIHCRIRRRLVQVLSSDLSSARCVLGEWQSRLKSCSRGACSRASGQVWVQATTSKGGRSHKGAYRLEMGTPRKNARMQECKNARDATQHVYLAGRRTAYYAKSFMLLAQNIRASSDSRISSLPRSQNCRAASRAPSQTSNVFAVACGSISPRGGTWPSAVGAYSVET